MKIKTAWRVLAFSAVFGLGLVGCGGDEDNPAENNGGSNKNNGDGGTYDFVELGGLKWMTKNLNVETADSWCYEDSAANCYKYGRLYTWAAADKACQSIGWRLPSLEDWDRLAESVGGTRAFPEDNEDNYHHDWNDAGEKLKSKDGWFDYCNMYCRKGSGTDDFGFSALPGGFYFDGIYDGTGYDGHWWTATETPYL